MIDNNHLQGTTSMPEKAAGVKKVVVRRLENTNQKELARLYALSPSRLGSFETYDATWRSSQWHWWGTHPLADEIHRWVLDAEGEIVGHLAALPQYYRIGGRRIVAHTPAEYIVLPKYGFHAITLMREFFRTCENCVSHDRTPATIAVQARLGAEVAGQLQERVKLWDVSVVPGFPTWVPLSITQLFNWGLQVVDRALNDTTLVQDLNVEVLEGFDDTFDGLYESVSAAVSCLPEKDSAFLRWRYGPGSPQESALVLGVKEGEKSLLGYAVLWVNLEGNNAHVLDLMTRPARHDVALALLREATRYLRRLRVSSARYGFVESPTSPRSKDMWRLGFFPRNILPSPLFVKFADSALHKIANDTARWSYSTGDGEGSHWM